MYFYMNHPFEFYFLFCIPQIRPAVSSAFSDVRNERSTDDTGTCVWYGICPDDRMKYCLTNQTAPKLDSEAQALLSVYCPELVHDADNTFTCCDIDQVGFSKRLLSSEWCKQPYTVQMVDLRNQRLFSTITRLNKSGKLWIE